MAKKVGQVRFYSNDNAANYSSGLEANTWNLVHGGAFRHAYPIVQLGVQTLPGTQMYINGSSTPIIIGSTGIYELDIDGLSQIVTLAFSESSLQTIANNETAYLIVDYVSAKE